MTIKLYRFEYATYKSLTYSIFDEDEAWWLDHSVWKISREKNKATKFFNHIITLLVDTKYRQLRMIEREYVGVKRKERIIQVWSYDEGINYNPGEQINIHCDLCCKNAIFHGNVDHDWKIYQSNWFILKNPEKAWSFDNYFNHMETHSCTEKLVKGYSKEWCKVEVILIIIERYLRFNSGFECLYCSAQWFHKNCVYAQWLK